MMQVYAIRNTAPRPLRFTAVI